MKKILSLIIALICLVPNIVKADMGAPEVAPYEMVVTNQNGMDYYDYDGKVVGHLNKGDKFKVRFEYDSKYDISISGYETYTIYSLKEAVLDKEEIDPRKEKFEDIIEEKGTLLIYAENGVDLLKGPSPTFSKVGVIKKGEEVKYTYKVSLGTYVYVDYNGQKGWVDTYENKALFKKQAKYILVEDKETTCGIIPKNTILKSNYETDIWGGSALVTYKNCETFVRIFKSDTVLDVVDDGKGGQATAKKDFEIYEYAFDGGKKLGTISNGAKFKTLAVTYSSDYEDSTNEPTYVEYNGITGWIKASDNEYEVEYSNQEVLEDESDKEDEKDVKIDGAKKTKKENKKTSAKDYTLMYVIIGVSVALAALVIIVLINRKKKLKKESN